MRDPIVRDVLDQRLNVGDKVVNVGPDRDHGTILEIGMGQKLGQVYVAWKVAKEKYWEDPRTIRRKPAVR